MRIAALWRHPIKSHGAEALDRIAVTEGHALPFDRHWAVAHQAATLPETGWAPCQNFSRGAKAPGLMAISARMDEAGGRVQLTHPDLGEIDIDPDREGARLIDWAGGLIPGGRAQSVRVVRSDTQAWTDTPFPSISLASLASLEALSDFVGQRLDPRRFRANIWIDGAEPWAEYGWIGKEISIGDVCFRVEERIERCLATHANPETGKRDVETLDALQAGWGHRDFGIYLTALTSGEIAVGNEVSQ